MFRRDLDGFRLRKGGYAVFSTHEWGTGKKISKLDSRGLYMALYHNPYYTLLYHIHPYSTLLSYVFPGAPSLASSRSSPHSPCRRKDVLEEIAERWEGCPPLSWDILLEWLQWLEMDEDSATFRLLVSSNMVLLENRSFSSILFRFQWPYIHTYIYNTYNIYIILMRKKVSN